MIISLACNLISFAGGSGETSRRGHPSCEVAVISDETMPGRCQLVSEIRLVFVSCLVVIYENVITGQGKAYGWLETRVKHAERVADIDAVTKKLL